MLKTILLVDDSRAVRLICRRVMSSLGFESLEAEHGRQALDVVRSGRTIDVILLDWNMPVMDGLEFLRALAAEPLVPRPTVIMCTTENEASRIAEALAAGATEYIMKPFNEEIVRLKFQEVGVL
jgi:two-component system chemotaxis response regulator CheY